MISEVPIISIKSLWNEGLDRHQTVQQIHTAMQNIGFFYIVDHGVDEDLVQQMGYFPVGGELTSGYPDRKEGIYLGLEHSDDHPGVKNGWPTFGSNQWLENQQLNGFKDTYQEYINKLTNLAHLLMQAISEALQLPLNYFEERFTKDPTILFRIFNYPKHIWNGDEWGVREHTDYGFLTILKQDNSGGLQVKTRDHRWIDAPPVENSFVINIGDMLELWTHGLYRATPHRVRNQAPNDRISLPFFFDPSWESTLEPIPKEQLPQINQALIQIDSAINRWDGIQLEKLSANTTYGQHLFTKLSKIWLELLAQYIFNYKCDCK
ncbi:hypothetical protein pb186bvf_000001 [Paramecium bursaria]